MWVQIDDYDVWNPVGSSLYWVFCEHTEIDEYNGFLRAGVRGAWWAVFLIDREMVETFNHTMFNQYHWTFNHWALLEEGQTPPPHP